MLTPLDLAASSGLGSLVGMRHAFEAVHLAAVSTLVAGEKRMHAAWIGAVWGLGHTLTLAAGGTLLAASSGSLPPATQHALDGAVAALMVLFGGRAIRQAWNAPAQLGAFHRRICPAARWSLARQPLLVGAVHGLAGSGTLTALMLVSMPTVAERAAYLVLFGAGTTLTMAALSGMLGWPLAMMSARASVLRSACAIIGVASIALGLGRGYDLIARWV